MPQKKTSGTDKHLFVGQENLQIMRKVHKRAARQLNSFNSLLFEVKSLQVKKVSAILIWANWLILFTRLPTTGLQPKRSHTIIRNHDHDDNLDHHDHPDHHDGHQCRRGLFASSLPSVKSEWPAQRLERLLPCVRVLQSSAFGANGAVRTSTSIHLHLASPYVICSISYELLTEGSGEKRNGSNGLFLQSSPLHIHTFDLHQDNTCLLLFKNGAAFRITVTSTEETKLCLHHL